MKICLDCATIFYTPLTFDRRENRAKAEKDAVDLLVCEAFGSDAVKNNHPDGSPFISLPDGSRIPVSISHCHTCAVLAVARNGKAIGIDAETDRPQLLRVASRVFSPDEIAAYAHLPHGLLTAWTIKEALYKAAATPGADMQADIRLPMPPGHSTAHAFEKPYRIIFSQNICNALVSVVTAL